MTTASTRGRRLLYTAVGLAIAATPAVAGYLGTGDIAPRMTAQCNDVVDTEDSFSMSCVPPVVPDVSDQLTEAEVATPGFNAAPGGRGGGSGGGGGGAR